MNKALIKKSAINFTLIQLVMFLTSINVATQLPIQVEHGFFSLILVVYMVLGVTSWIPAMLFSVLFAYFGERNGEV